MSPTTEDIQDLLLDLLATSRPVGPTRLQAMAADDWERFAVMLRQHRMGPMLQWRLQNEHADVAALLPDTIRDYLAQTFRRASLRMLRFQRELLLVQATLAEQDIPVIPLKGARLAFAVYPHPASRLMRDLDVLVPREKALQAFQALLDAGWQRVSRSQGDPDQRLEIESHLPQLETADGKVLLELHVRLSTQYELASTDAQMDALWAHRVEGSIGAKPVFFLSDTDALRHVISHATFSHQFNNGPNTLSDVAYLIQAGRVNWADYWQRAEQVGLTRASILVLRTAQYYFGNLVVDFSPVQESHDAFPDSLITATGRLMLCDTSCNRTLLVRARLHGLGPLGKLRQLWREVALSEDKLRSENESWGGLGGRLMGALKRPFMQNRAKEFFSRFNDRHMDADVERLAAANKWMGVGK